MPLPVFGKELAKVVLQKGEKVAATFRSQQQVDNFTNLEKSQLGLLIDVANPKQIKAGIAQTLNHFGRIDLLINNAG